MPKKGNTFQDQVVVKSFCKESILARKMFSGSPQQNRLSVNPLGFQSYFSKTGSLKIVRARGTLKGIFQAVGRKESDNKGKKGIQE